MAEWLQQRAGEAVAKADLSEGERFLAPDFGVLSARSWTDWRFGIELRDSDLTEISGNDPDAAAFKEIVRQKAREAYRQREIEYPVLVGLAHFTGRQDDGSRRVNRDGLVGWAKERFDSSLDETSLHLPVLKNLSKHSVKQVPAAMNNPIHLELKCREWSEPFCSRYWITPGKTIFSRWIT